MSHHNFFFYLLTSTIVFQTTVGFAGIGSSKKHTEKKTNTNYIFNVEREDKKSYLPFSDKIKELINSDNCNQQKLEDLCFCYREFQELLSSAYIRDDGPHVKDPKIPQSKTRVTLN